MSQSFLTGSLLCCCKQIIELPDDFYILIVRDIDTLNRIIHQFFQSFIIHGTCTLNDCLFLLCLIFLFKKIFINKYQNLIENHVLPELGHYKLKDLNSDTLHGFLEKQGSTGNKKNGGSLSISTLQTLLYILNSSIKYAASNNMIALFSVHLLGGGKSAAPISCLSEKDESALDTYLSAHLSCRNMGIMLSLYCGLRIGEVCGLQWADIDFEHKLISIKRTVQRIRVASGQRKTKLWVGTPKSKSSIRTIPIPDFLMSALYALSAQSCSDAYILTRTDEPLDPRTLQYYFNKVTISCGIGKINYHILRHTFATNCVALGFDIKTLSEILGHSNVSITLNKYVHPSIQQKTIQMAYWNSIKGQIYGHVA